LTLIYKALQAKVRLGSKWLPGMNVIGYFSVAKSVKEEKSLIALTPSSRRRAAASGRWARPRTWRRRSGRKVSEMFKGQHE
jgi:hypothetical protein